MYYAITNEDPKFFLERTPIYNLTIRTKERETFLKVNLIESEEGNSVLANVLLLIVGIIATSLI